MDFINYLLSEWFTCEKDCRKVEAITSFFIAIFSFKVKCLCRPCILFFDSLYTEPWDDVATTIRNYLSSEYRVKFGTEREFNHENMPDYVVDVPQQDNAYDSGLFVLQYAESFFKVSEN